MGVDKARSAKEIENLKAESAFWFEKGCEVGHSKSCEELQRYEEYKSELPKESDERYFL